MKANWAAVEANKSQISVLEAHLSQVLYDNNYFFFFFWFSFLNNEGKIHYYIIFTHILNVGILKSKV